jgi:hypothetical protein
MIFQRTVPTQALRFSTQGRYDFMMCRLLFRSLSFVLALSPGFAQSGPIYYVATPSINAFSLARIDPQTQRSIRV